MDHLVEDVQEDRLHHPSKHPFIHPGGRAIIAAPMVDQSELPFRLLCREFGAEVTFTPMFHGALFVKESRYREDNFSTHPSDRPLIVQFCANDPDIFAAAAKIVESECDGVDLNLGCPQGIAKKGHYGAFLQDEWNLISSIIKKAKENVKIPISCKIRVFPDVNKTILYAKMLVSAGADMLTIHGRTREMKGQLTGLADWSQVRAVKESLPSDFPVISNGNIQFISDIDRCLLATSADGIMSAEGLLYNPALFTGRHIPVWILGLKYLDYWKKHPTNCLGCVKAHVFKLLHNVIHNPDYTFLRDLLSSAKTIEDYESVVEKVRALFEIPGEDQSLEMTTLPVPLYVSQPFFRQDRRQENESQNPSITSTSTSSIDPSSRHGNKIKMNCFSVETISRPGSQQGEIAREARNLKHARIDHFESNGNDRNNNDQEVTQQQDNPWKSKRQLRREEKRAKRQSFGKDFLISPTKPSKCERKAKLDLCSNQGCSNIRGCKCSFHMCKTCCRAVREKNGGFCENHTNVRPRKSIPDEQNQEKVQNEHDTQNSGSNG